MLKDDLIQGAAGAANYTGLPRHVIYRLTANGDLPAIKKGSRSLFYRKSDLDRAFRSDVDA